MSDDKRKPFSVRLNLTDNAGVVETFDALQELKRLGYADNNSQINVRGVYVPAGYCGDFHQFSETCIGIATGDHGTLFDQVSDDFDDTMATAFLRACSSSLEKMGRDPFTDDEIRDFLEYRNNQKSGEQK